MLKLQNLNELVTADPSLLSIESSQKLNPTLLNPRAQTLTHNIKLQIKMTALGYNRVFTIQI